MINIFLAWFIILSSSFVLGTAGAALVGEPPMYLMRLLIPRHPELEWEFWMDPKARYEAQWRVSFRDQELSGSNYDFRKRESFWQMVKAARQVVKGASHGYVFYRGRTLPCPLCGDPTRAGQRFCSRGCERLHTKALMELGVIDLETKREA